MRNCKRFQTVQSSRFTTCMFDFKSSQGIQCGLVVYSWGAEALCLRACHAQTILPAITNPDARLTTLCATSNTAITMFHVLVTMTTAHAVLNTYFASMNVSMSCMLLRSTII